ncbi:SWEET family sugar transporter [Chryseobacterium sp. 09-1422]|uniref:SWEET family sugar transporter n=1 Tax=Chryseobacterium kimseyorum TaxID=2984028 RepID=A0ABT3HWM6_9FLAO|nr:SWEET family sugar transporter [Chryseobacterium kimseyorum]MCW3168193.1 SWEET family sugar transporter [Chryseobacterium kimseyorum]
MDNDKFFRILGIVATITSMAMYVSYIPQISSNLDGQKGDWLQPLVAAINCMLWVIYGVLKKPKRDLPIIIANSPGILFGLFAFFTAL